MAWLEIELSDFEEKVLDNWNRVWYNGEINRNVSREDICHLLIRQGLGIQPLYYTFTSAGSSVPVLPSGWQSEDNASKEAGKET